MAGCPKKRARREAAEARAAGQAPGAFVEGAPPGASSPTVYEVLSRPVKRVTYSDELAEKICTLIARVPVARICEQAGFPCETTLFKWRRENKEFDAMIAIARQHRAEARTDRIDEIVDEVRRGRLDPIAARMIFDAERWLAGREHSARYADNSTQRVELTGAGGGPVSILADDPAQAKEVARYYALIFQRGAEATRQLELQPEEFVEVPASGSAHG